MWNKFFRNFCVAVGLMAMAGCSVLFPTKVPAPGDVHTMDGRADYLEQRFSGNAIVNQEPPVPPVNGAPV
ncbi:MAG TPA: hypothetical protein VHE99_01320 [Gammaproteobacteria bacterium]|nr:hypothetical protein [Gammaproteobacteria bacterium]